MSFYSLKTKPSKQYYTDKFLCPVFDADALNAFCLSSEDSAFVGTDNGLFVYNGKDFERIPLIEGKVSALFAGDNGLIYAAVGETVYTIFHKNIHSAVDIREPGVGFCRDLGGNIWLATKSWLYKLENGEFRLYSDILYENTHCIAAGLANDVYAACPESFLMLHGKRPRWGNVLPGFAPRPESKILSLAGDELGFIWLGCEDGVYFFDGKSEWKTPDCFDFLPRCPVTYIGFAPDNEILIGTKIGLYTVNGSKTRFLGIGRYLAGNEVKYASYNKAGDVLWVLCREGVSRIERKEMTLEQKEAYYASLIPYYKREGFVTMVHDAPVRDYMSGKTAITDNDGFWTSDYVCAMSMRYAVTTDENARKEAAEAIKALWKLETITGINGFPARAYRRPGEDAFGDGDTEWHLTQDEKGELEWKGETSSDELVGHFLANALFFDFCADETEKTEAAKNIGDIMNHIIEHGFTLCDADGLSTTWAHFGPEDLNENDTWCWEKGINSLELLSFLNTAYHITGNKKYYDIKNELAGKYHYALNITTHKVKDEHTCHIDDRLGYCALIPFVLYEENPAVRRYLTLATRRHYEYEWEEHCPLYVFATALLTEGHIDLNGAVESLEEYPLDLYSYEMKNSYRPDITVNTKTVNYASSAQCLHALPMCERAEDDMCYNAFDIDREARNSFMSPALWQFCFWFAKYYGMIE